MSTASLRAVIVDDERLARSALRRQLAVHPSIDVVAEAGWVAEAAALVAEHRPDAVFLDVQMRGETGFDLLTRPEVADVPFRVVFVTAFDAYAVRAFEVNARDYLLKPVDPDRLAEAVHRLAAAAREAPSAPPPPAAPTPEGQFRYDDLFLHDEGRHPRFIRIAAIATIRTAGNYTELYTTDGDMVLVHKPLAAWAASLPTDRFVQVHRTALINTAHVERMERAPNYTYQLHLRGVAEPVPMSRRRASALKHVLGER